MLELYSPLLLFSTHLSHTHTHAAVLLSGPDHPEVSLVLDRLADVIRARDAPEGLAGAGLSGDSNEGALMASRRNGGTISWWRGSSLTSRGSSWFESAPSMRSFSRSRSIHDTRGGLGVSLVFSSFFYPHFNTMLFASVCICGLDLDLDLIFFSFFFFFILPYMSKSTVR